MTFTGCPCGCMTKLPYLDDPDCIRNRTGPQPFVHVDLPPTPMIGDLIRLAEQIARRGLDGEQ